MRNRHKLITAEISDLVLDIALFPAGLRIHEHRFETVVFTEPLEAFGDLATAALDDVSNDSSGIIEPDFCRGSTDVLEHRNQSFQKAFHVFPVVQLEITAVTVGKTEDEVLCLVMQLAVLIEIGYSKIGLCFARMVFERKITLLLLQMEFLFLFGNICGCEAI